MTLSDSEAEAPTAAGALRNLKCNVQSAIYLALGSHSAHKMSSAGKPSMLWAAPALLAVAVRCAFVEFPVERADELTMARFKAEYADKLRPVVIRGNDRTRAEAALWSAGDFRDRCGAGEITRYVSDASSSAWGGFDMRGERRVPLASFFGEVERSNRSRDIYGFDYNLKCDCEAFVEQTTILPYFKQDVTAQSEP